MGGYWASPVDGGKCDQVRSQGRSCKFAKYNVVIPDCRTNEHRQVNWRRSRGPAPITNRSDAYYSSTYLLVRHHTMYSYNNLMAIVAHSAHLLFFFFPPSSESSPPASVRRSSAKPISWAQSHENRSSPRLALASSSSQSSPSSSSSPSNEPEPEESLSPSPTELSA